MTKAERQQRINRIRQTIKSEEFGEFLNVMMEKRRKESEELLKLRRRTCSVV